MTDAEHLANVKHWLRYTLSDLNLSARLASEPEGAPWQACFHAQQAVEKALKAILVFGQIEFHKTHDLESLAGIVPPDWRASTRGPGLAELSSWAVEGRYPGDWPDATPHDAHEAVGIAREVVDEVLADFAARGVRVE